MQHRDLCVAWTAEQDAPFIRLLDDACRNRGLSVLQIKPDNRDHLLADLDGKALAFGALFDRASDEDLSFLPLVAWADTCRVPSVNPYARARRAADKAATHRDLGAELRTPRTLIVPPYAECLELGDIDLRQLGVGIIMKPAHGGGGDGVVIVSAAPQPVQAVRQHHPKDSYLLQEHVRPAQLGGRPAWFRVIYAAGRVYPFWWDPRTHVYQPVTVAEESRYGLRPLQEMAGCIARICGLGLFSTEIAWQENGGFLVVDYVNDPLDLTPQSVLPNGVPNQVLAFIAEDLADWVVSCRPRA